MTNWYHQSRWTTPSHCTLGGVINRVRRKKKFEQFGALYENDGGQASFRKAGDVIMNSVRYNVVNETENDQIIEGMIISLTR